MTAAGQIEISAQNHNYAVDPSTLPDDVRVTHINLNDGTCAGLLLPSKKVRARQHPLCDGCGSDGEELPCCAVTLLCKCVAWDQQPL